MRVLVTGVTGFIGSNVVRSLLKCEQDIMVVGVDNMDPYYDLSLKEERLKGLLSDERFLFLKGDISDKDFMDEVFRDHRPEYVLHFAAKVGVRHSVSHPEEYITTNINGFFNILEACRKYPVSHLVYASSSSVYGANASVPYSTDDKADSPVSLYAATKKSNELMTHAYSQLYAVPSTGLRFFTVYGPAGRPDMAYFSFTDRLVNGKTIQMFNSGNSLRDYTYIDDITEGVLRVMKRPPVQEGEAKAPYALYNIGNSHPENLMDFVRILCEELIRAQVLPEDFDLNAHVELLPMQPGDVPVTYADVRHLEEDFDFKPSTQLRDGLRCFAQWYAETYN